MSTEQSHAIIIPEKSTLTEREYRDFLEMSWRLMSALPNYLAPDEGLESVELSHTIPAVPETVIAIYVGINDAVCNKGLVTRFLVRHGHNNVFAFDRSAEGSPARTVRPPAAGQGSPC